MNRKQIIIVLIAFLVGALILWHDLPVEFPWMINMVLLFVKVAALIVVTILACVFAGRKKSA